MADFYAIPTAVGEAKLANALALGIPLQITQLAVGDGSGIGAQGTPLPDPSQTALVSERRRAPLNTLSQDPVDTNVLIAEQVIPEDVGGWWIREMGLFDSAGDLIAVCNTPPTYKPVLGSGSGRTQVVRMQIVVSDMASVTLKIDPAIVVATRQYVDQRFNSIHIGYERKTGHFVAVAGRKYFIDGAPSAELPVTAGLATGATVQFIKRLEETPIIQVNGSNGEHIKTASGTDTAVTFDINAEIVLVWTGTEWEV